MVRAGTTLAAVAAASVLSASGVPAASTRLGHRAGARSAPKAALHVVLYHEESGALSYTLNCNPASGTLIDPRVACEAITKNPSMVFAITKPVAMCSPPPGVASGVSVSGVYDRRKVKVDLGTCTQGHGAVEVSWQRFLPTEKQLDEISIDHGIGPLALGGSESAVGTLLVASPPATIEGLAVYEPRPGDVTSCGGESKGERWIMALRYESGDLETMIENRTLSIDGEQVRRLVGDRCGEAQDEASTAPLGPMNSWFPVTCGGQEAFADHALGEDSAEMQGTTIVLPAVLPVVVVTSDPTSACEDVARLHAQWGT